MLAVAQRLLSNAWLVEAIEQLPPGFTGVAVTRAGRVWHGRHREMRQAPEGGEERVLAERNRREELIARQRGRRPGRAGGARRLRGRRRRGRRAPTRRASRPTAACARRRRR